MTAISFDQKQELVALYLTMFGHAPTAKKLDEIVQMIGSGKTLAQVANTLTTEAEFAPVMAKDLNSFAVYFADSLTSKDLSAVNRVLVIDYVKNQLITGMSVGSLFALGVQTIRATTASDFLSSKAKLAADVNAALTAIDNPPPVVPPADPRLEALAQSYGVTLDAIKSFIGANVEHPAVCYAYVDQLGINFSTLLDLLQFEDEAGLRKLLLDHGLAVTQLGINKPAAQGYSSNSTKLTTGADTYSATDGKDSVDALAGDDVVNGLAGNDLIYGGDGNDTIDGGRGRDYLDGGAGNDTLRAGTNVTTTEGSDSYSDGHVYNTWTTYTFDDVNAEFLYGRAGNDKLYGGYGSDYLDGGEGDDLLESDYNTLHTSEASPAVLATMMNDTLCGGAGADTLKGGDGNDTYLYRGLPGTNEVPAGETIADTGGTDTLWAMTSTDFSVLNGGTATLTSMGLDRVLINSVETATFTAVQLSGTDISINATGQVAAELVVKGGAAAGTYDFSKLQFSAFGGNNAFDSGVDKVTLDFSAQTGATVTGTSLNDTIMVGAQSTVTGGAGADKFVFNSSDVDTTLGVVTHTITDFNVAQGDTLDVGISATESNCILINLSPLRVSVAELLKQADLQLGGTYKIALGKVGKDFYVVSDLNGVGYTQVIRLVGIDSIEAHPSEFILS